MYIYGFHLDNFKLNKKLYSFFNTVSVFATKYNTGINYV